MQRSANAQAPQLAEIATLSQLAVELFQADAMPAPSIVHIRRGMPEVIQHGSTAGLTQHIRVDSMLCNAAIPIVAAARDLSGNVAAEAARLVVNTPDIAPPFFVASTPTVLSVTAAPGAPASANVSDSPFNMTIAVRVELSEPAVAACSIQACASAARQPGGSVLNPMHGGVEVEKDSLPGSLRPLACTAPTPTSGSILQDAEAGDRGIRTVGHRTIATSITSVNSTELAETLDIKANLVCRIYLACYANCSNCL